MGNWWDVITLPPHGYVKMRTWINVPDQVPTNNNDPDSDSVVVDNANIYGSWVLRCHILRHEDRGMMTMVNTRPKAANLSGKWFDDTGAAHTIVDRHGALTFAEDPTMTGTFNQGLGNPLVSQPWLGATTQPNPANPGSSIVVSFCITDDANQMVFSNGHLWAKNKTPAPIQPAVPPPAAQLGWQLGRQRRQQDDHQGRRRQAGVHSPKSRVVGCEGRQLEPIRKVTST